MQKITFATELKRELVNITYEVEKLVSSSKVSDGLCLIFAPHATCALYLNEDEDGLKEDILDFLQELVPDKAYKHNIIDNNAQAHILSSLIGTSITLPVKDGRIVRGTWQNIFFVELDGPRLRREVIVKIVKV
jgi:secondary thiamine-phosphate synthase enzyme